jgi:hypothetical protein
LSGGFSSPATAFAASHEWLASHPAARKSAIMSFMVGTLERCVGRGSLRGGDERAGAGSAAAWPRTIP